jgi:hypothetical protein
MSSIATAPSRNSEKDLHQNKQLHYLADPEPPVTADPSPAESPAAKTVPLDDVTRVERLITQLEARSMALVPYNYANLRDAPAPKANRALLASSLVAIWLSTLVFAVAYMRFANQPPLMAERAPASPLIIPTAPDPQEQKVASSVDHLAKALVSSSERLNQIEAAMERSNRDLQRMSTKVANEKYRPVPSSPKPAAMEAAAAPSEPAAGNLPKNWHRVIDLKPNDMAVPHRTADGSIDYWLVPRGTDKPQAKVLTIGTSVEGVVVHNLEDGKDYTLTPSGEWRNGSVAPPGN